MKIPFEPIDTRRIIEIPEGVALQLPCAGPAVRATALVIDTLIKGTLYLLLLPLLTFSDFGWGVLLLGVFLVEWFYPVFFELRTGATPGKRIMGLLVVTQDGTAIRPAASLLRNLLRAADFLPFAYGVGLVATLMDRDFRRIGDLAAGTLVVHRPPARSHRKLPQVPAQVPPQPLSLDLQEALLDFAERSPQLSRARRVELAERLTSITGHRGERAVQTLLGYANWVARGRLGDDS